MKKYFWASLLLAISMQAYADLITGQVVGVADGDTITVLDSTNTQHKIRLAGIDAPEKKQAFGNVSKRTLSDLVFGKQVEVEWTKHDRYQRIVGKVMIDGTDANLEQIKRGMAWFYKRYKNELSPQDRQNYSDSEEIARKNKVGLWADSYSMPPWDFRQMKRGL